MFSMATSLPSFTLGPFHLNCKLWAAWVDGERERERQARMGLCRFYQPVALMSAGTQLA